MKKGKFFTFHSSNNSETFSGVLLDYNTQWLLIRFCVDYNFNGYRVIENSGISFQNGSYERLATKILQRKKYSFEKEKKIPLTDIGTILTYITKKHIILQLNNGDENGSDVVKFIGFIKSKFVFKELTVNAKWRYRLKLDLEEIKSISFDTDYLNSLKLLL